MDVLPLMKSYEKLVYFILIITFSVIVAFSILELIYLVAYDLIWDTPLLLENNELLTIFGYFLLVLIGVELLTTIIAYVNTKVIHVEIVIMVAIIAIVRGVILLDTNKINALNMFGLAAIIFTLCSGYYFLRKGGLSHPPPRENHKMTYPFRSQGKNESWRIRGNRADLKGKI
jgi:uncharacterized membrane protein (DUF373 family)